MEGLDDNNIVVGVVVEGTPDGIIDGCSDVDIVGTVLGKREGDMVGLNVVGSSVVGCAEGLPDGSTVRFIVSSLLGRNVGMDMGLLIEVLDNVDEKEAISIMEGCNSCWVVDTSLYPSR